MDTHDFCFCDIVGYVILFQQFLLFTYVHNNISTDLANYTPLTIIVEIIIFSHEDIVIYLLEVKISGKNNDFNISHYSVLALQDLSSYDLLEIKLFKLTVVVNYRGQ